MDFDITQLQTLAQTLPIPPAPAGGYQAVMIRGGIGFVSGQFPIVHGELRHKGRVGLEMTEVEAATAVRLAAVNVLAQINTATDGFERFGGLLRIDGYFASAPDYWKQPQLLDVASSYFLDALGPSLGAHARSVLAVPVLPLNASVELLATFHFRA